MSEEFKTVQNRRDFVKTAAKVAVTAPAAAMLFNASVKPAKAVSYGDDYQAGDDPFDPNDAPDTVLGDNYVP